MWHPASLLLSWVVFSLGLQRAPAIPLLGVAVFSLLLGEMFSARRSRRMLWASRWLLLSLAILFVFFTPGEYLPGFAGALGLTFEGMWHAGEQLSRLVAMLASLALLHERIGTQGLLAGLYWLTGPFAWRKTTVVRLMLVLDLVEEKRQLRWREWLVPDVVDTNAPDNFSLAMPELHLKDKLLMGGLLMLVLALALWS
jgi:hypothetical protein